MPISLAVEASGVIAGGTRFYEPTEHGAEAAMRERLAELRRRNGAGSP